jgi:two-component system, NtrC family, sensor kinase
MVAIGHQAALAVEDTSYYSAMVQAERLAAIGQTIATLSHHIKNILQGIRGGSYLIEEGLKTNETDVIRKGWGIVEKNQERISTW